MDQLVNFLQNQMQYNQAMPIPPQTIPMQQQTILSNQPQFILNNTFTAINRPQQLLNINNTMTVPTQTQTQTQTQLQQQIYPISNNIASIQSISAIPQSVVMIPANTPQIDYKQIAFNTNTNMNNLNISSNKYVHRNAINISKGINPLNNMYLTNLPNNNNNTNHNHINLPNNNNNMNDIINYIMQTVPTQSVIPCRNVIQPIRQIQPIPMQYISPSTSTTITMLPTAATLPKLESDSSSNNSMTSIGSGSIGDKEPHSCYCSKCGKHFKNSYNLLLHERKQHSQNNNNIFPSCQFCGKEFVHRGNLKQHIKTHVNKSTVGQNAFQHFLNRPKAANHANPKCYKCRVCFKSFTKRLNMVQHQQIHSGERKYVCTICNSSYISKSTQKNHMKKAHPLVWETIKHRFCDK